MTLNIINNFNVYLHYEISFYHFSSSVFTRACDLIFVHFVHANACSWLEPLAESSVVNLRASCHTHYAEVSANASRLGGAGTGGALNSMRAALADLTHLLRFVLILLLLQCYYCPATRSDCLSCSFLFVFVCV